MHSTSDLARWVAAVEQRGYTFETPTKEHPYVSHILLRDEIVAKISFFVLDCTDKEIKRFLDNIDLRRQFEAERKEEADVCGDCYGRFLPMRQLQVIYPDWPPGCAPVCEYCTHSAKYHIKRSEWIKFNPM